MNSLPTLPDLDEKEYGNYASNKANSSKRDSFGLPAFVDAPSFAEKLDRSVPSDLLLTGELAMEYRKIKHSYRELIHNFEMSLQKDMSVIDKSSFSQYQFKSLADFELAVEKGQLNLNEYTMNEINDLIRELNKFETKMISRNLDEYDFKTIDDFQNAVDNGIIDLSRYKIAEINELLNKLEDAELDFKDYDVELFGNLKLPDIETVLLSKPKPTKKQKISPKLLSTQKKTSLPSAPDIIAEKPTRIRDDTMISADDNIEDLLGEGFLSKLISKIKKTFKRGP